MTKISEIWGEAAIDLMLEVIMPFDLVMSDQTKIRFDVLLKNFGTENGMLVVDNLSKVTGYFEFIQSMGYGCSVVSPYPVDYKYDRDEFLELLEDWGWTGPLNEKPAWLNGK